MSTRGTNEGEPPEYISATSPNFQLFNPTATRPTTSAIPASLQPTDDPLLQSQTRLLPTGRVQPSKYSLSQPQARHRVQRSKNLSIKPENNALIQTRISQIPRSPVQPPKEPVTGVSFADAVKAVLSHYDPTNPPVTDRTPYPDIDLAKMIIEIQAQLLQKPRGSRTAVSQRLGNLLVHVVTRERGVARLMQLLRQQMDRVTVRADELDKREEAVGKREQEAEWAWEQQEAVLVKANRKGIKLAGAVLEQRALMERDIGEDVTGDGIADNQSDNSPSLQEFDEDGELVDLGPVDFSTLWRDPAK